MALQDRNETLFYHLVLQHLQDYMPIIYTPTVGEAALNYGAIFRRARGLYVTADDRGQVAQVLQNWTGREPRVIVVTDGGRVLGLGDLGANGMTISYLMVNPCMWNSKWITDSFRFLLGW